MIESPTGFAEAMDRCWRERRFEDLSRFMAPDVVMVAPNGDRIEGRHAAADSYRSFMERCEVDRFQVSDEHVVHREATAVIDYRWSMDWREGEQISAAEGRELLVLSHGSEGWRVVWRTQLPG